VEGVVDVHDDLHHQLHHRLLVGLVLGPADGEGRGRGGRQVRWGSARRPMAVGPVERVEEHQQREREALKVARQRVPSPTTGQGSSGCTSCVCVSCVAPAPQDSLQPRDLLVRCCNHPLHLLLECLRLQIGVGVCVCAGAVRVIPSVDNLHLRVFSRECAEHARSCSPRASAHCGMDCRPVKPHEPRRGARTRPRAPPTAASRVDREQRIRAPNYNVGPSSPHLGLDAPQLGLAHRLVLLDLLLRVALRLPHQLLALCVGKGDTGTGRMSVRRNKSRRGAVRMRRAGHAPSRAVLTMTAASSSACLSAPSSPPRFDMGDEEEKKSDLPRTFSPKTSHAQFTPSRHAPHPTPTQAPRQ
jgi:hypothetical protein